ncbi:two-component regulator propeller domain-containing protein [Pontibacter toksunensis]|uniref:histidine kinase n=1 Tax=Pontibacter toksunensis TaxID=1332631 RepID=A0ABW6BZB5_9BACT
MNNEIKFEMLGMEQGLNGELFNLMQDRKGYMWFSSLDGLYRYDGYTFTHFQHDPRNKNSLADNSVNGLYADNNGLIWIGLGAGGGVNSLNPQTGQWKLYNHTPLNTNTITNGPIHTIQQDHSGNMWFGSLSGGLSRYNSSKNLYTHYNHAPGDPGSISSNRVPALFVDKDGQLWVGTSTGLDLFNPKTNQFQHIRGNGSDTTFLYNTEVHHIYQDNKGLLWLSTLSKGVFVLDPIKNRFLAHYEHNPKQANSLSDNYVLSLVHDNEGSCWISTASGLNRLDLATGQLSVYEHEQYLPGSQEAAHMVLKDQSGLVWLSTSKGALFFSPKPRKFHRYLHDLENALGPGVNQIYHLFKGSDKQVYVATTWSLLRFNPLEKSFSVIYETPKDKSSNSRTSIYSACEEKPGVFWLATPDRGIIRLDTHTNQETWFKHDPNQTGSLAHNNVNALYKDRNGVIWVGTEGGQLQWLDAANRKFILHPIYTDKHRKRLDGEGVRFIYEDKQGHLWVATKAGFMGTGGGGLFQINRKDGKTIHYRLEENKPNSLSHDAVTCLYEDTKGVFWIGTSGGGLNRLEPNTGKATFYTKEDGLQSNKIDGLAGDMEGNIWISSNKGITFFNPVTLKMDWFDLNDGLTGSLPGLWQAYPESKIPTFQDEDGTIYLGGKNGLTVFHPEDIYVNQAKPPIAICQFKVFDKTVPVREEGIVLQHDQNFFRFEFAALSFLSSAKNQYRYKLEGIDKDWVYSGTRRIANYTNVPPGTYTFLIKGSNNDGVWNEEGKSVPIIIHPPWWRTGLAYILYTILIIGSIWAFVYYRSRNLLRQKRQLESQVATRTAEVEHQKEELQVALEDLKATQAQLVQKEKMASLGELTAGIAHEIQNPLNFVNNFSELSKEMLTELQQELETGAIKEAKAISVDIQQNLHKIHHHGSRADAIVKNMLQHSRPSTGEKQLVNLNTLTEEYLRLSYCGIRAKYKDFTCTLDTTYDQELEKVKVVPQELGQVLLNLFNNAFYAVQQKKKLVDSGYEPKVVVNTRRLGNKVEIRVWDNGTGVADNLKSKVFQPFFTTKPTGQGTGLGLSLSYDIITKGHGGEMRVTSKEGEWCDFTVSLPYVPVAEEQFATSTAPLLPAGAFPQP